MSPLNGPMLPLPRCLMWALVTTLLIGASFASYPLYVWEGGASPPIIYTFLYASLARTLWSLGLAALICLCHTGNAPRTIAAVLHWPGWRAPARLCYCVYLVHRSSMPPEIALTGHLYRKYVRHIAHDLVTECSALSLLVLSPAA